MPEQESPPQGGASELASFGEELRREREIRGISLKEISDATKISKRFLEALERNDHRTLPAPVFTRGFVREYARYVGLSAEDMVNRYNYAASQDDRIEKPPQIEKYPQTPVRDISPRPKPKRGIPHTRVDRNAVLLVVIAVALGGVIWWAVRNKLIERELGLEPSTVTTAAAKPVALPLPAMPAPAPPPPDDSKLRLELEAIADSWVGLRADDNAKSLINEVLERGEKRSFEADEKFNFRTGNAAGIIVRLNGIELPPLGGDGDSRRLDLDREYLIRLRTEQQKERP